MGERIIKNLVIIDLKNKHKDVLFVNTINGLIDIVHSQEYNIIKEWIESGNISVATNEQKNIYKILKSREYILTEEEEFKRRNEIIKRLKKRQSCLNLNKAAVYLILTYNCNFACPYCYESHARSEKTITKEMVDRIFELNPNVKHIGLFGGEPFLLSNKKIIDYILNKKPRASYSAITNGYYLEEYADIIKLVKFLNIQVTLDGSECQHNKNRFLKNGRPTYDKIIKGIKKCIDLGIHITIRMNVSTDNIQDCLDEKARIEQTSWGKKVSFELQALFQCSSAEHNFLCEQLLVDDINSGCHNNMLLQRLSPISNFLYNNIKLRPVIKACDYDDQLRYFDPEGYIYNCILAVGNKHKSIGTYYPDYVLNKDSFITRDITTIKECTRCPNALLCGGGCANAIGDMENIYQPNCYSFLNDIVNIVPLIYKLKYREE